MCLHKKKTASLHIDTSAGLFSICLPIGKIILIVEVKDKRGFSILATQSAPELCKWINL